MPPLLTFERNWKIKETEPVGSVIIKITSQEHGVTYELEPKPNPLDTSFNQSLPFRIDNRTGVVYLNESLKGRVRTLKFSINNSLN